MASQQQFSTETCHRRVRQSPKSAVRTQTKVSLVQAESGLVKDCRNDHLASVRARRRCRMACIDSCPLPLGGIFWATWLRLAATVRVPRYLLRGLEKPSGLCPSFHSLHCLILSLQVAAKTKAPRSSLPVPAFALVLHPLAAGLQTHLPPCPASASAWRKAAVPLIQDSSWPRFCDPLQFSGLVLGYGVCYSDRKKKCSPKRRGQMWSSSRFWRHYWISLNRVARARSALNYMPDHGFVSYFSTPFWACPNWHMSLAIIWLAICQIILFDL